MKQGTPMKYKLLGGAVLAILILGIVLLSTAAQASPIKPTAYPTSNPEVANANESWEMQMTAVKKTVDDRMAELGVKPTPVATQAQAAIPVQGTVKEFTFHVVEATVMQYNPLSLVIIAVVTATVLGLLIYFEGAGSVHVMWLNKGINPFKWEFVAGMGSDPQEYRIRKGVIDLVQIILCIHIMVDVVFAPFNQYARFLTVDYYLSYAMEAAVVMLLSAVDRKKSWAEEFLFPTFAGAIMFIAFKGLSDSMSIGQRNTAIFMGAFQSEGTELIVFAGLGLLIECTEHLGFMKRAPFQLQGEHQRLETPVVQASVRSSSDASMDMRQSAREMPGISRQSSETSAGTQTAEAAREDVEDGDEGCQDEENEEPLEDDKSLKEAYAIIFARVTDWSGPANPGKIDAFGSRVVRPLKQQLEDSSRDDDFVIWLAYTLEEEDIKCKSGELAGKLSKLRVEA